MLDETILEQHLVTLEQAVSDLQRKVESKPSENWLKMGFSNRVNKILRVSHVVDPPNPP